MAAMSVQVLGATIQTHPTQSLGAEPATTVQDLAEELANCVGEANVTQTCLDLIFALQPGLAQLRYDPSARKALEQTPFRSSCFVHAGTIALDFRYHTV